MEEISGNSAKLTEEVTTMLFDNRIEFAVSMLKNNADTAATAAWELVPIICTYFTKDIQTSMPKKISACEELLNILAEHSNPKELLLILLEQCQSISDDVKYLALLPPLLKCLLSLPAKRSHSVSLVIETICKHPESLPKPKEHGLEGEEERMLLDLDQNVSRMNDVIRATLNFLEPLVDDVSWQKRPVGEREQNSTQVLVITDFLMRLLSTSLAFLDLSYSRTKKTKNEVITKSKLPPAKSASRVCAEKLVSLMCRLQPDFHRAMRNIEKQNLALEKSKKRRDELKESKENENSIAIEEEVDLEEEDSEEPISVVGIGVFTYLAISEGLGADNLPYVFEPQYILESCSSLIVALLSAPESLVVIKGISLFTSVLDRMDDSSASAELVENPLATELVHALVHVMTMSHVKELAQSASKLFPVYLGKFPSKDRNRLYHFVFNTFGHSGLTGYATQLLVKEIDGNLKSVEPRSSPKDSSWFIGSELEKLLKVVLSLPNGVTTDLLQQSERIMASLNLLRFLVVRDRPDVNTTGVWSMMTLVQNNYCEVLRKAINMSRAHYQLDLDKIGRGESQRTSGGGEGEAQMTFSVGGKAVGNLTKKQRREMLQLAIVTFDMMESILCRVSELIDEQRRRAISAITNASGGEEQPLVHSDDIRDNGDRQ